MKVLVTGAGGFIGSHLTQLLLETGHQVVALVHYNGAGSWQNLNGLTDTSRGQLDVRLGDITDAFFVRSLVSDCDVVLHLAALIGIPYSYVAPASYVATNVGGTLNILEACRLAKTARVVVTSTSEVYGTARTTPMEESHPLQGQSPYSASKIGADKLAEAYFLSFNTPVVTLRPFNTYGPRQSSRAVIPTIISQALAGAKSIRLGNLKPRRDLTFVQDTARAFLLAATVPGLEGETIHFGQGSANSVAEIAKLCLEAAGSKAEIIAEGERMRPERSEVELLLCNRAKAERLLNWRPEFSLAEGIAKTVDYLRGQPALAGASGKYQV